MDARQPLQVDRPALRRVDRDRLPPVPAAHLAQRDPGRRGVQLGVGELRTHHRAAVRWSSSAAGTCCRRGTGSPGRSGRTRSRSRRRWRRRPTRPPDPAGCARRPTDHMLRRAHPTPRALALRRPRKTPVRGNLHMSDETTTAVLRSRHGRPRDGDQAGGRGLARLRHRQAAVHHRADHARLRLRQHRRLSVRDHLHRRRRRDPALPRLSRSTSWPRSRRSSRPATC